MVTLNANYSWILEAEISNAIIGMDSDKNLVWYKGIWYCGRWFGGNWISGAWLSGDWYYGKWTSKSTTDNLPSNSAIQSTRPAMPSLIDHKAHSW